MTILSGVNSAKVIPIFCRGSTRITGGMIGTYCSNKIHTFRFAGHNSFTRRMFTRIIGCTTGRYPRVTVKMNSVISPTATTLCLRLNTYFIMNPLFGPRVTGIYGHHLITCAPKYKDISRINFTRRMNYSLYGVFPNSMLKTGLIGNLLTPVP